MKDVMEEKLLSNSDELVKYLHEGSVFIKEQAPLFVQEVLRYKTNMCYYGMYFSGVCLLVSIICAWKGKQIKNKIDSSKDEAACFYAGSVFFAFVSIMVFAANLCGYIKITQAPRLFILETIRGLM
jgi:hypothetical protein